MHTDNLTAVGVHWGCYAAAILVSRNISIIDVLPYTLVTID